MSRIPLIMTSVYYIIGWKRLKLIALPLVITGLSYYILKTSMLSWEKYQHSTRIRNPDFNKAGYDHDSNSQRLTYKSKKLLTLFTTFKDVQDRKFIHRKTILNWASLGGAIKPVIFANLSDPSTLITFALDNGWLVVPPAETNSFGTPFLKDMYRKATYLTNSYFYGFCNGDLLFDTTLLQTLESVLDYMNELNTTLIIGRRTNVNVEDFLDIPASHFADRLSDIAKTKGSLFKSYAEDFFFISDVAKFPWHTMKDIVIGRPAYDNYLVGQALNGNVSVIDATQTLLALHQTGSDGNKAGFQNIDVNYNKMVIGRYKYRFGRTEHAQYETVRDIKGRVILLKRNKAKPVPSLKPTKYKNQKP